MELFWKMFMVKYDGLFFDELILIQHSLVNGCFTMTPAKSTPEPFKSSF
jgi:hypothetical protein